MRRDRFTGRITTRSANLPRASITSPLRYDSACAHLFCPACWVPFLIGYSVLRELIFSIDYRDNLIKVTFDPTHGVHPGFDGRGSLATH